MLEAGKQLDHYRIISKIGAGGMGEVFLAVDTRLKRSVVLKVLASDFSRNKASLRRFEQEALAVAALNHPNIAHIYEIGEADGLHFIAMEFVDGVTLHEKIYVQKTPFGKLLKYLTQIAEGLAKAHAAGIVHRDLKPDNIMIDRDDYAKVLDFGLAKLLEPRKVKRAEGGAASEIDTAILAQPLSTPGIIMGTVGYMSPEQAQGKTAEIDHRSDIFSFGCILFEVATGRKAFEGQDMLDTLHKIVYAPTPQIKDIKADAPPELQRIVRRCLAKEPDKRYQSIKDVALELDELRQDLNDKGVLEYSSPPDNSAGNLDNKATKISESPTGDQKLSSGSNSPNISSAEYLISGIKSHKNLVGVSILTLLLTIGGISFAFYQFWSKPDKPPQAMKIERLTTNGKTIEAAISPDGKYVVYALSEGGQQSLWTRQVATKSNVQIIPPADVKYFGLVFTPDSNYINFIKQEKSDAPRTLYQMPVLGGIQKKLISSAGAAAYSPDGKLIAFVRYSFPTPNESSLLIVNADGTGERILASLNQPEWFMSEGGLHPAWSPDGKTIACVVFAGAVNGYKVVEVQIADGSVNPTAAKNWHRIRQIVWLADKSGLLILGADKPGELNYQQIWRIPYPDGEARRITNDFHDYLGMSLAADSNALVAVQTSRLSNIWVAPNGDSGRGVQIKSGGNNLDGADSLAWTPDGRIVYYSLASGKQDIWIMNGEGSGQKQLTVEAGRNYAAKVTPDGRYIVFTSDRNDGQNIWRMDLDGANPKQLTSGNGDHNPTVSPDSQWVIYSSYESAINKLWKVSIDGGSAVQLTDYPSLFPEVSPDGKLIALRFRETPNLPWRYAIIPFEGGKPVKIFDLPGGTIDFLWSKDGSSLIYNDTRGGVSNLWSFPLDGAPPIQLTNFKTEEIFNFDWSADGKQLVLARGSTTSDVVLISNFK